MLRIEPILRVGSVTRSIEMGKSANRFLDEKTMAPGSKKKEKKQLNYAQEHNSKDNFPVRKEIRQNFFSQKDNAVKD